jgi:hypothetical protein
MTEEEVGGAPDCRQRRVEVPLIVLAGRKALR